MDIQLRAFWRAMQYGDRWSKSQVLLTGATGFLGAFLLRDLLNNTKVTMAMLVVVVVLSALVGVYKW